MVIKSPRELLFGDLVNSPYPVTETKPKTNNGLQAFLFGSALGIITLSVGTIFVLHTLAKNTKINASSNLLGDK